jgi:hypothetical protein
VSILLHLALIAAGAGVVPTGWEKVHTVEGPRAELGAIMGGQDGGWIAAGGPVIVRGGSGAPQRSVHSGKYVVGLGGGGTDPVFAVGGDDLILRWDGTSWSEESFAPEAEKLNQMRRRQLLLQGVVRLPGGPLVAYGPWRILQREPNGKWQSPSEEERYRLMTLTRLGPARPRPKGCSALQWRWLTGGDGWLNCRDRRSFVVGAGGDLVDRGRMPAACANLLGTVVRRGASLFAACHEGEVWRSEGTRWERVAAPKVDAIAVSGPCLYGVSGAVVWRNCSLP